MGRGARSRGFETPRGIRVGPRVLSLPLPPSWMLTKDITKECGLDVDCNRVQERAVQRLGVPSAALRAKFYSKTCTWANNVLCCEAVAACKVERGVTRCGEM